jgi:predicted DNA-binding transcriptional regulator AlpA
VAGVVPDDPLSNDHLTTINSAVTDEPGALVDVLASLRALPPILVRLAAALDRQAAAGFVEPLLNRRDVARVLRVSLAVFDRLRSAGRLPRPDVILSRSPRWRAATIRAWIEKGGRP